MTGMLLELFRITAALLPGLDHCNVTVCDMASPVIIQVKANGCAAGEPPAENS